MTYPMIAGKDREQNVIVKGRGLPNAVYGMPAAGVKSCLAALILAAANSAAWPAEKPKPSQNTTLAAPKAAGQASPKIPDDYKLTMLIRTTLIALNQANATGNYSVLRDLAAPGFQQANTQARLTDIFANIRNKNIDLSPTLFYNPQLVRPPRIEANGLLRLSGRIPTQPEQVNFDLAFQLVGNDWRLYGIAVDISASTANAPQNEGAAQENAKAAKDKAAKTPSSKSGATHN